MQLYIDGIPILNGPELDCKILHPVEIRLRVWLGDDPTTLTHKRNRTHLDHMPIWIYIFWKYVSMFYFLREIKYRRTRKWLAHYFIVVTIMTVNKPNLWFFVQINCCLKVLHIMRYSGQKWYTFGDTVLHISEHGIFPHFHYTNIYSTLCPHEPSTMVPRRFSSNRLDNKFERKCRQRHGCTLEQLEFNLCGQINRPAKPDSRIICNM